jgi:DNA adenine methylase
MGKLPNKTIHFSPLRYPGGKNCIFQFVSQLLIENQLIGSSYAEPYAGGAGLALRLLFEGCVEHVYINDLDHSIYSLWHTILNRPEDLCNWIRRVRVTVRSWNRYKNIQKSTKDVDMYELAKATFFLNRTNISGVIKGGVIGGQSQHGKYKIDARFNKADLINRIRKIAEKKDQITLSNLDGLEFIKKMNSKKEPVFIYLDPPYYQKGADLYMNYYTNSDHERLSKHVHKIKDNWMVSYDNHDFILNLYAQQKKVTYKLSQSASNRIGDEVLIFSKKLRFRNSIQQLKSPVVS